MTRIYTHGSIEQRFWKHVDIKDLFECWLWKGATDSAGYGSFRNKTGTTIASRISYFLVYGIIPKGKNVLHHCDNPLCVNPSHLFLGTQKDNIRDCVTKKRIAIGEHHGRSKLTESDILKIYSLLQSEISQIAIAKKFNVSGATIHNIKVGKNWKHLYSAANLKY